MMNLWMLEELASEHRRDLARAETIRALRNQGNVSTTASVRTRLSSTLARTAGRRRAAPISRVDATATNVTSAPAA